MRYFYMLICMLSLAACNNISDQQRQKVELLNHRAFNLRYTSLDSIETYASQALSLSKGFEQGKAESYNNLALAAYMRQDFVEAEKYYNLVKKSTSNQIELLLSDIGMLKVCSRASANKRFYDYEARVQNRLKQIHKESDALNAHDMTRLTFAESDFHLAASIYYYYLQHDQKAKAELEMINGPALAEADSIQWTYYQYMLSSVDMLGGTTFEEDVKLEFDTLLRLLFYAREKNLIYIEANVLETFVDKLVDENWYDVAFQNRQADFIYLNPESVPDSLLTESISKKALDCFKRYGDYYQLSGARRRLSDIYFQNGNYEACFKELEAALNDINTHFDIYNKNCSYKRKLQTFVPNDTVETDLKWMENDSISTVPQWLANIRQSLSLVYAALGNKEASDYNRNIYLDLLDRTRQDKEQENRLEQLKAETNSLNILFWIIAILTVLGSILLIFLNRKWRKRNTERIHKFSITAELCSYITSSIPTDVEDNEELLERMADDLEPKLNEIFGCPVKLEFDESAGKISLVPSTLLVNDDKSLLSLIEPYLNWAYQYGSNFLNLDEEYKQLEKERYLHEQHIAENKRKNLEKRTCMSIVTGITPFLDRAINEINRLNSGNQSEEQKLERYDYIHDLIDRINEYNDIMALWIKMKQGALSLQIESFNLGDIFATIAKGKHAFESKELSFLVDETSAIVKADKALTLFMINTLCDNARKYTPKGGSIYVKAEETDTYIEISVKDTGRGLSEEDRKLILEEKVYDSSKIGMNHVDEDLKKNKGFGFGLMNCKGIIDKYKKTNPLFSVCLFGIESEIGKGSRFFFRLPKGILRFLIGFILLFTNVNLFAQSQSDKMLMKAAAFADSTYYSNVDGYYEDALIYADSACVYLNKYYKSQDPNSNLLMSIDEGSSLAELAWYDKGIVIDYHVILDIRNEVAVAALALGEWGIYKTNNEAYTKLYKLLGEDKMLDEFCHQMQTTATNKTVSIILLVVVMLAFVITIYSLYFRQALLYRINVQQVLEANHKVLKTFQNHTEEDELQELPGKMLERIYPDLVAIHPIDGLAILIKDADNHLLDLQATDKIYITHLMEEEMKHAIRDMKIVHNKELHTYVYPLLVKQNNDDICVGAFAFIQNLTASDKNEAMLRDLVIRYVSIVIYQTVIRLSHKHAELEVAEDEKRRAIHEENILHVQNMVLDNCLSTLKHETMYYPNRIKLIVDKLQHEQDLAKETEQTQIMHELVHYYKDIFTTLSDCANRQLENLKFSRKRVPVDKLKTHLEKYFNKIVRKNQLNWTLESSIGKESVLGDEHLLCYLMDSLVDAALEKQYDSDAVFYFSTCVDNGFVRFTFEDPRGSYTQAELNLLFYPDLKRMQPDDSGKLHGTQYLNMRQIIRDHDELCRHRGCRINAEPLTDGGYKIWFTIPVSKNEITI